MNIVEGLGAEIQRVTEILGYYEEIGAAGALGATFMRASLAGATAALGSGDPIAMIAALNDLKDYSA